MKVISGGQTGVDRAALDAALSLGLHVGGWVPRGRRAQDGKVPAKYQMREAPGISYPQRTQLNVRDSDATLVLHRGKMGRGTRMTVGMAEAAHKLLRVVDMRELTALSALRRSISSLGREICVLNVAGPSEDTDPGVYTVAREFVHRMLRLW